MTDQLCPICNQPVTLDRLTEAIIDHNGALIWVKRSDMLSDTFRVNIEDDFRTVFIDDLASHDDAILAGLREVHQMRPLNER